METAVSREGFPNRRRAETLGGADRPLAQFSEHEPSEFSEFATEALQALAAAPAEQRLGVFQVYAIRVYARAEVDGIAVGDVSDELEEIARRHDIATLAGGQGALQHILSEAALGRRALVQASAKTPDAPLAWEGRIIKASELRMMQFPPLKYTLPGLIPIGFTIFASKPKVGKSWFMLDVSLAVTIPRMTLGNLQPCEGDVLYLALEDSKRRLQNRIDKLLSPFSQEWPPRLDLVTQWSRGADAVTEIDQWCARHPQARMVVIDVIEKIRPPENGNGAKRLYALDYEAISPLQKIAHDREISVVGITHLRKQEADDVYDTVSGSLGVTGAADTTLLLQRQAGGVTLHAIGRDIEQSENALQFNKGTCRWTILGSAADVHRSAERGRVLAALEEAAAPMKPKEIQIAAELTSRNATDILLGKMVKAGEIVRVAQGLYALPPGQTELKDRLEGTKAASLSVLSEGGKGSAAAQTADNGGESNNLSDLSALSGGERPGRKKSRRPRLAERPLEPARRTEC